MISKGQRHIETCYLRMDFLCKPTPTLLIILPVAWRGPAFRRVDDGPIVAFVLMSSLFLLRLFNASFVYSYCNKKSSLLLSILACLDVGERRSTAEEG